MNVLKSGSTFVYENVDKIREIGWQLLSLDYSQIRRSEDQWEVDERLRMRGETILCCILTLGW